MTRRDNAAHNSFVLVQIGDRRVALPAGIVVEMVPPVLLHVFPHTTPSIAGVIVRRGRIVPVFDASALLFSHALPEERYYLVARRGAGHRGELSAIAVNGECQLVTGEMQPASADRPSCIAGTLAIGPDAVDVLDLDALVALGASLGSDSSPQEARP